MQTLRGPGRRDYHEVVKTYMYPSCHVLDIGTGGGEMILSLANFVTTGIGIDPDPQIITAAHAYSASKLPSNISWGAEALQIPGSTFDVNLNRQPLFMSKKPSEYSVLVGFPSLSKLGSLIPSISAKPLGVTRTTTMERTLSWGFKP